MNIPEGQDLFTTMINLNENTWEALKFKIAQKLTSSRENGALPKFIMIFGGSSVTEGKDIYFRDSYPLVVERRLKPLFDAMGIELIVRNIAMTAMGCDIYNAVYEPQADPEPDFVGWSVKSLSHCLFVFCCCQVLRVCDRV